MNKSLKLFYINIICFLISIGIEYFFQSKFGIYNIGIIAMLFLVVCLIHDIFKT